MFYGENRIFDDLAVIHKPTPVNLGSTPEFPAKVLKGRNVLWG